MAHIEAQGRADSTLTRYRSCINANIKPRLGSKAVNKLGPAELDRFYGQLARDGLKPLHGYDARRGRVGIRTIAGRVGHANPGITLRTDREVATAIGDALADLQPASTSRPNASSKARRGTTGRRPNRTDGSSRPATRS